jgi:hypothetical protein
VQPRYAPPGFARVRQYIIICERPRELVGQSIDLGGIKLVVGQR